MSNARSHLRICDAYGNRKDVVALDGTYFEIGGDRSRQGEKGFVHVEGSGVEPRHARLIRNPSKDRWQLVPLTGGSAKLGRRSLERDTPVDVAHGDEIWLGNNLLQLMDVNKSVTSLAVMPELGDLELMMNEALLDYEDRRRDLFDGDDRQREELLSVELDRLLGEALDLAG